MAVIRGIDPLRGQMSPHAKDVVGKDGSNSTPTFYTLSILKKPNKQKEQSEVKTVKKIMALYQRVKNLKSL